MATISLSAVRKTATYLRAWDEHPGSLTLMRDGLSHLLEVLGVGALDETTLSTAAREQLLAAFRDWHS